MQQTQPLNTKESASPKIILNNKGGFFTNPNDSANQFAPTIQYNLKPNFKSFGQHLTKNL